MSKNLIERLNKGPVLCAEGYLFAMERRGYLSAGSFVPEVVLEHPEVVSQLHREFIRAGSDVVQAFTYYGHREKLRIIGKEKLLEPLQKNALKIAKDVSNEFPELDLMIAGNVANTNIYDPSDKQSHIDCQKMFAEQIEWAKQDNVDFVIAETMSWTEEARIALKEIKDAGLIAVVNLAIHKGDRTREGHKVAEACKILEDHGADVGGHLMGQKVTDQVAEMRSLPAGIDQRSPARHPDWMGPDDLALKVQELRELTDNQVPIQLKLGASRVYDDVRMAAKCDPDSIFLDSMEGSTAAGPHIAAANTGIPGIGAIREARRALDDVGKTGEISLVFAGGIRDGADMAKALALGADAL